MCFLKKMGLKAPNGGLPCGLRPPAPLSPSPFSLTFTFLPVPLNTFGSRTPTSPVSLSLSLALAFLSPSQPPSPAISPFLSSSFFMAIQARSPLRCRTGRAQLNSRPNIVVGDGGGACRSCSWMTFKCHLRPLSSSFMGLNKFILISSSKWYPSFLTKVPESSIHFFLCKTETLQVDLSQIETYFEAVILNSYS